MIKDYISASMEITVNDFDFVPFHDYGGVGKAYVVFVEHINMILKELNKVMTK